MSVQKQKAKLSTFAARQRPNLYFGKALFFMWLSVWQIAHPRGIEKKTMAEKSAGLQSGKAELIEKQKGG